MGYSPFAAAQLASDPNSLRPGGSGGMKVKWVILGGVGGGILFAILMNIIGVAIATGADEPDVGGVFSVLGMLGWFGVMAGLIAKYVWVYKSWEMIPEAHRCTDGGQRVTPGTAVGFLFIPGFAPFYWVWVVYVGLCSALNRVLAAQGSTVRAPKGLAIATGVCLFIPYLGWVPAIIMALIYFYLVDVAKAEVLKNAQTQGLAPAMPY
jgi:hypothetical protein